MASAKKNEISRLGDVLEPRGNSLLSEDKGYELIIDS